MLIINRQHVTVDSVLNSDSPTKHDRVILTAMVNSPDIFQFPTLDLLHFTVNLRSNIIDSANMMHKSAVKFATFYSSRCNETYWRLTNDGGFELRAQKRSSQAIQDIYENGDHYAFECATAMVIVLLRGVLDTIGTELFDQLYRRIVLWDWHEVEHLPLVIEPVSGEGVPGEVRYFKNPDVNPRTPQWQGENVIQLPNDQFFGHGIGIATKEDMIKSLNKNRKPGAERSGYLMKRATRVNTKALVSFLRNRPAGLQYTV